MVACGAQVHHMVVVARGRRYITVDAAAGRALFYVMAQSASASPADDPLVLWLNG